MKKLIYWYGVYWLCLSIHEVLHCMSEDYKRQRAEKNNYNKTNETAGKEPRHTDDTDWKPMNKIGFQISAE